MKRILLASVAALLGFPAAHAMPTYTPVGPQFNVAVATVTSGGWTACYSADFGTPFGADAATTLAACTGDLLMVAGYLKGSGTYALLAEAPKAAALFDTGAGTSNTHLANGSQWYNSDNWSFGFTSAGQSVTLSSCDIQSGADRFCIHTIDWTGGYRVGDVTGLNSSTSWEKVIFSASSVAVPEPVGVAMFGAGLIGLGAARRRRVV